MFTIDNLLQYHVSATQCTCHDRDISVHECYAAELCIDSWLTRWGVYPLMGPGNLIYHCSVSCSQLAQGHFLLFPGLSCGLVFLFPILAVSQLELGWTYSATPGTTLCEIVLSTLSLIAERLALMFPSINITSHRLGSGSSL